MEEFVTACPRNCYSTCTFRVQVSDGIIKRILPYEKNLACPGGPCIKGLSYIERAHSPERIIYALIKDKNGIFRQEKIDKVLRIIAERLEDIKNRYGSHSILWYKGSGNSGLINETGYTFWKYFGGVTTTYGNLCWPAGLEAVLATLGSVKHNVPWDLENANAIIIWGKNPAETNIQEMAFIIKARLAGATVVVIDPRRTPTADKADYHFRPRPGSDAALALAVARVLVEKGRTDNEFISRYVKGFDEFRLKSLLIPADAEKICGIPQTGIELLAEIIANSSPVTFLAGYGVQRYRNGGQTIRAIMALPLITGNIGKKGAGFNYANLQGYIYDNPKEPLSYYPDSEKDKPFRRTISMARVGNDILNTRDPKIKAIWVERGNPLLQSPETAKVRTSFARTEFRVVVEQFMTDTAKEADIILPSKDIFEQSDIVSSYWSPYIQFKPKILEPAGEIMPESDIYYHLSKLLGLNIPEGLIPEPGNNNTEKWLEKRIEGVSAVTLDKLKESPVIAPGLQQIAYCDMKFETPSGKIELFSESLVRKWGISPLPDYTTTFGSEEEPDRYPLTFISPNTASRIHSQFGNLDVIKMNSDPPAIELSANDASERNIVTGDTVRLFNDRGSVTGTARISGRISDGMVVLCNGIWINEGGGSNLVTAGIETDIGHGAAFHGQRVQIEKILRG